MLKRLHEDTRILEWKNHSRAWNSVCLRPYKILKIEKSRSCSSILFPLLLISFAFHQFLCTIDSFDFYMGKIEKNWIWDQVKWGLSSIIQMGKDEYPVISAFESDDSAPFHHFRTSIINLNWSTHIINNIDIYFHVFLVKLQHSSKILVYLCILYMGKI